MPTSLAIGDLVVCSSPSFRAEMSLGLQVGIFLVERPRDGLVYFAGLDRSAWIPRRALKAVAANDSRVVAPPAWLVGLHQAMRLLEATDLSLERNENDCFEARIGCAGLDARRLGSLQELLGARAPELEIRPGSMHRILVVFPTGPVDSAVAGS